MKIQQVDRVTKGIIKTLVYSDIFDYPLKPIEIYKYYNGQYKCSKIILKRVLNLLILQGKIGTERGYYFLPGRGRIVKLRQAREQESRRKLKMALYASGLLRFIPTLKFVGISGSLAVGNCRIEDDIDLFIVTSANTLWVSRFFVNLIFILTGSKRSKNDTYGIDKICPNMFMTEESLKIQKDKINLFTAREILQLKVLFDRGNIQKQLFFENAWIKKYFPNIKIFKVGQKLKAKNKLFYFLDKLFYASQFLYMSARITNEKITPNMARFHPRDKSQFIMGLYKVRLRNYLSDTEYKGLNYSAGLNDTPGY